MAVGTYYLKRLHDISYAAIIPLKAETVIRRECNATDIPHLKSPRISRGRHCTIYVEGDDCLFIKDEARNGTFLNSKILQRNIKTILKLGDEISLGVPSHVHGADSYQYQVVKNKNNVIYLSDDDDTAVEKNRVENNENDDDENDEDDQASNNLSPTIPEKPASGAEVSLFIDLDSDNEDAASNSPIQKPQSPIYSRVYQTINLLDDDDDEEARVPESNDDDDDVIFIDENITQENMNYLLSQTSLFRIKEERIDEENSRDSYDSYSQFDEDLDLYETNNNNIASVEKEFITVGRDSSFVPKINKWIDLEDVEKFLNSQKHVKVGIEIIDKKYEPALRDYNYKNNRKDRKSKTRISDKFKKLRDAREKRKIGYEDESERKRSKLDEIEPTSNHKHYSSESKTKRLKPDIVDNPPITFHKLVTKQKVLEIIPAPSMPKRNGQKSSSKSKSSSEKHDTRNRDRDKVSSRPSSEKQDTHDHDKVSSRPSSEKQDNRERDRDRDRSSKSSTSRDNDREKYSSKPSTSTQKSETSGREKPSTSSFKKPSTSSSKIKSTLDLFRANINKDFKLNNGYYSSVIKSKTPTKPKVKQTVPKINSMIPKDFVPESQMIGEPAVPEQTAPELSTNRELHVYAVKGDLASECTGRNEKIPEVAPEEAAEHRYYVPAKLTFKRVYSSATTTPCYTKPLAVDSKTDDRSSKSKKPEDTKSATSRPSSSKSASKEQKSDETKSKPSDSSSSKVKISEEPKSHLSVSSTTINGDELNYASCINDKGPSTVNEESNDLVSSSSDGKVKKLKSSILLPASELPNPDKKKLKSILRRRDSCVRFSDKVEERYFQVQSDLSKDIKAFEGRLITDITKWKYDWLKDQETVDKCPINRIENSKPLALAYKTYEEYEKTLLPILKMELLQSIFADIKKRKDPRLSLQVTHLVAIEHYNEAYTLTLRVAYSKDCAVNHGEMIALSFKHSYLEYKILGYVTAKRGKNSGKEQSYIVILQSAKDEVSDLLLNQCFDFSIDVLSYVGSELSQMNGLFYLQDAYLSKYILRPAENIKASTGSCELKDLNLMKLNDSQSNVVSEICNRWKKKETGVTLIEGPPGTGKSATIANAVIQLLYADQYRKPRILICAESNQATDIIMRELLTYKTDNRNFTIARSGVLNKMSQIAFNNSVHELAKKGAYRQLKSERGYQKEHPDYEMYKRWADLRIILDPKNNTTKSSIRPKLLDEYFKLDRDLYTKIRMECDKNLDALRLYTTMEKEHTREIINNYDIICTTLNSANKMFRDNRTSIFDICVVDEATQASELAILLPLQFNMKMLVMVGDTQQLPNTVVSKTAEKLGYNRSLFARIIESFTSIDKTVSIQLNVQYRMHPEILKWPNKYFYNNSLRTDCELIKKYDSMNLKYKPYTVFNLLDADQNMTQTAFHYYNYNEIEFITQILEKMMEDYIPNEACTYGIITPYARQKTEFDNVFKARNIKDVFVTSIDSCQGQERDVIIISVARTKGTGFLIHPQRLNVALTRAKKCLILCGNFNSLYSNQMWNDLLHDAQKRNCLHNLSEDDLTIENVLSKLYSN